MFSIASCSRQGRAGSAPSRSVPLKQHKTARVHACGRGALGSAAAAAAAAAALALGRGRPAGADRSIFVPPELRAHQQRSRQAAGRGRAAGAARPAAHQQKGEDGHDGERGPAKQRPEGCSSCLGWGSGGWGGVGWGRGWGWGRRQGWWPPGWQGSRQDVGSLRAAASALGTSPAHPQAKDEEDEQAEPPVRAQLTHGQEGKEGEQEALGVARVARGDGLPQDALTAPHLRVRAVWGVGCGGGVGWGGRQGRSIGSGLLDNQALKPAIGQCSSAGWWGAGSCMEQPSRGAPTSASTRFSSSCSCCSCMGGRLARPSSSDSTCTSGGARRTHTVCNGASRQQPNGPSQPPAQGCRTQG